MKKRGMGQLGLCILEEFQDQRSKIRKEVGRTKRGQEIPLADNIKKNPEIL